MEGRPKWEKFPFNNIGDYLGIQWKLLNVKKMSAKKVKEEIRFIEDAFGV